MWSQERLTETLAKVSPKSMAFAVDGGPIESINALNDSLSQTTDDDTAVDNTSVESDTSDPKCCDYDVSQCPSVHHIAECLAFYQNHDIKIHEQDILSYFLDDSKHKSFLNDWHHILGVHLNRDLQTEQQIHKSSQLMFQQCLSYVTCRDINLCRIYKRHHRNREHVHLLELDDETMYIMDMMDTIHCHLLHSQDCGYRAIEPLHRLQVIHPMPATLKDDMEDIRPIYADHDMSSLRLFLKDSRNRLEKLRGDDRLDQNKFVTKALSLVVEFVAILPFCNFRNSP